MTGIQPFQAYKLGDLQQQQKEAGKPYFEFLRRRAVSMGIYTLPADGTDFQHPHASDEVYLVLNGKAKLQVEGELLEVGEGSVISVDHGMDHKFQDISEDLQVLVVFAPPESPTDEE